MHATQAQSENSTLVQDLAASHALAEGLAAQLGQLTADLQYRTEEGEVRSWGARGGGADLQYRTEEGEVRSWGAGEGGAVPHSGGGGEVMGGKCVCVCVCVCVLTCSTAQRRGR